MKNVWLYCSLAALLVGCPESPPSKGGGGDAGSAVMGGDAGGGAGGGGSVAEVTCYDDLECPDDQYCLIPEGDFEGRCQEGCRDDDACPEGQACNPSTRECGSASCDSDEACPDGSYCSDDATCEEGCRLDDACPGEQAEDGRPLRCDPESRACVPHSACCVPADSQERCEELATASQCEERGGQLMVNVLLCSNDPCGERCELDVDCEPLDAGDSTYFCDPDDGRCRAGCREGDCGGDLVCDLESRICVSQSCAESDECGEGRYCDPVSLVCLSGCGVDSDCEGGLSCINNSCVERCDPVANDCPGDAYCDPSTLLCRARCDRHEDCAESEACDPSSGRCVLGACRDDEPQGDLSGEPNNTFESASNLTLVPIPSDPTRAVGRALERAVCGVDLDLYSVGLTQGERMRIQLSHDAGADLTLRLFSETDLGQPLIETALGLNPDLIEYPEEGLIEEAQRYYIEVSGALDANDRVRYDLNVQTAPLGNACFLDPREEGAGDDDYSQATALVSNGTSRFNDASVCVGDEDWYSLPLTVNDGLIVTLSTPIDAQPVSLNLYSIAGFGGITETPPPKYHVSLDDSIEDSNSGLRIYSLFIERDSAGFDIDGQWLLSVSPSEPQGYATYELTVVHESAGGVCVNEGREPNNSVSEGADLEEDFGFMLEEGQLSLGRANRVLDGVICSGDVDYYCLNLSTGDKLSASVASDTVIGSLEVRVVNGEGVTVGNSATHTATGEVEEAFINGAPGGEYCVVVDGLGNAQGSYELTVTRSVPVGGACAEDELDARDDSSDVARALVDVSGGQGLRFEQTNALMCDPMNDPADWYQFNVNEARSRICVMLDGFDHDVADLDVELFAPPVGSEITCSNNTQCSSIPNAACVDGSCQITCTTDSQCEALGSAACVEGTCQLDAARSVYSFDFEMTSQPRVSVDSGQHYLRVRRGGAGAVSPYDLSVTVTPGRDSCQDDWQELGDRNDIGGFNAVNIPTRATQLGSGAVGLCDAWLCNNPGGLPELDWYQISIPAGQDRTVIINFDSETDGPLDLYYWGETQTSMQRDVLYMVSTTNTNYQCLNLRGGTLEMSAELGVQVTGGAGGAFIDDGDQRIDYSLRVVPTDLDADPAGACPLFGAGSVDICNPNDPNDLSVVDGSASTETCWPEVSLP